VNYSRDIGGVHCEFINFWPDSANRVWMESDLADVPAATPVIIFTHSPPICESKNFTNPNGSHDINGTDKFQNLLVEQLKDGAKTINDSAKIEMQEFADFLKRHTNVKAYFHGHDNANQFYIWTGPNNDVQLHTYRVDSPMKGNVSKADETKLSFQSANACGTLIPRTPARPWPGARPRRFHWRRQASLPCRRSLRTATPIR
jgi:hypothetical protein